MAIPPIVAPDAELTADQLTRAARQVILPGFGIAAQRRIAAARVLVVGAGGLGSPVLQYLAGAGVGTIGIVDDDVVDASNLQRQVIHSSASIGESKTASAARRINALDPAVTVIQHTERLTSANALAVFGDYDLIVDGSDNFPTRYLASDAAAILRLPYVWGSVLRFDGQVAVFWEGGPAGSAVDYRDLHPVPPPPASVLSCDEAGVLGTLCGTIGSMMAGEAIKLITGIGVPLLGRVHTVDALTARVVESPVRRARDRRPVTGLIDYELFCGTDAGGPTITAAELPAARVAALIDVREPAEHDELHIGGDRLVPLARLLAAPDAAVDGATTGPVVVYCRTGARSERAAAALRAAGIDAISLRGGIEAWVGAGSPTLRR